LIGRILAGDPLFDQLYQVVKRYTLASGETVYLYQRTEGPGHPYEYPVVLIDTTGIADAINHSWSEAATLYLSNPDLATWVGIHDLKADEIVIPASAAEVTPTLQALQGTILAATRYDTPEVQGYLHSTSYYAQELNSGEFTFSIFGRPPRPLHELPVQTAWEGIEISALQALSPLYPGEVLAVDMQAAGRTDGALKLSARLVNPAGEVIAQNDKVLSERIRVGLFLPPDAAPGTYTLAAIVYDPNTLASIKDRAGNELATIATLDVQARPQ